MDRLGLSREEVRRIHERAEKRKPTPQNLRNFRAHLEQRLMQSPPKALPKAKTIVRAFYEVQKARVRAVFLISAGVLTLRYGRNKKIADALRRAARRDLFYAKEKRLAQIGRFFRPVFFATRLVMPRQTRIQSPFAPEVLTSLPAGRIKEALAEFRRAGVLDEGPGWVFEGRRLGQIAEKLGRGLTAQARKDQEFDR